MKREFIVERQGRSFVLYAGLLDLAHSQGLRAVRTSLLQVPSEDNGQTAIVHAEVDTDRGTFSGIGDASPANVARAMLTCTIRLAETRAKARALRDAVNVGVTAFEELGDTDETPVLPPIDGRAPLASDELVSGPRQPTTTSGLATPAQVRAIYLIGRDQHNLTEAEVDERSGTLFGAAPHELSRKQASEFITGLKGSR
ncbi:MAG: hypothetical protein ACRDIY_20305 [Chloroflexota bacterium]